MSNDRGLERAILAGAIAYGPERVRLQPRATPTRGRPGARDFSGSQGGDLDGWLVAPPGPAIPLLVEAKASTTDGIALDRFTARQLADLAAITKAGGVGWIIAAFDHVGETFVVSWPDVADFFAAPWRRSLSLWHCRAVGLLVPDTCCVAAGLHVVAGARRVLFLDGKPHPDAGYYRRSLDRERERGAAARPRRAPKPAPPSDLRDVTVRAAAAAADGTRAARKAKR